MSMLHMNIPIIVSCRLLYDLWNALVFDGKNIVGKENDLISALTDKNAQRIKDIAHSMRTTK